MNEKTLESFICLCDDMMVPVQEGFCLGSHITLRSIGKAILDLLKNIWKKFKENVYIMTHPNKTRKSMNKMAAQNEVLTNELKAKIKETDWNTSILYAHQKVRTKAKNAYQKRYEDIQTIPVDTTIHGDTTTENTPLEQTIKDTVSRENIEKLNRRKGTVSEMSKILSTISEMAMFLCNCFSMRVDSAIQNIRTVLKGDIHNLEEPVRWFDTKSPSPKVRLTLERLDNLFDKVEDLRTRMHDMQMDMCNINDILETKAKREFGKNISALLIEAEEDKKRFESAVEKITNVNSNNVEVLSIVKKELDAVIYDYNQMLLYVTKTISYLTSFTLME